MNKRELIKKVSEKTQIEEGICIIVLDAFEEVFTEEISNSKRKNNLFEVIYKIMDFIKGKKKNLKNESARNQ